jgi:zinc D-Ala-D-Ala carboxypeptidase
MSARVMFDRPLPRLLAVFALFAAMLVGTVATQVVTATKAHADGCYTWGRNLSQGMSGEDVRQLQIRISGYPGYGGHLAIDGDFGPATRSALIRFQQAYGLGADGIAGPQTFSKIYELQDDDCTPIHFTYAELNKCNSTWGGGPLSAAATKANALETMWHLEAMRHAMGDRPLNVTSGFRSYSCNSAVGGASNSQHLYGRAADLVGSPSLCALAQQARNHGFGGIFGPGYPGHSDHTHVDIRTTNSWSASQCGI